MKGLGFSPTGCMPDSSCVFSSWVFVQGTLPGLRLTHTGTPGRKKPRMCSTLGCQWQLETLGWGDRLLSSLFLLFPNLFNSVSCRQECSFCASLKPLRALGMGPVSGTAASAWPGAWLSAQALSSVCTGCLSLHPPVLQSSPWNSGMRKSIHVIFPSLPKSFLKPLLRAWALCGCRLCLNEKGGCWHLYRHLGIPSEATSDHKKGLWSLGWGFFRNQNLNAASTCRTLLESLHP